MKKKVIAALAVVVLSAIVAAFFSLKIAAAIVFGSALIGIILIAVYINIKAWEDVEKKDPELAKKLWQEAMINNDFFSKLY